MEISQLKPHFFQHCSCHDLNLNNSQQSKGVHQVSQQFSQQLLVATKIIVRIVLTRLLNIVLNMFLTYFINLSERSGFVSDVCAHGF